MKSKYPATMCVRRRKKEIYIDGRRKVKLIYH